MVGHTGDLVAATRAISVVDECLGKVVDHLLTMNAHILITADHGNSEELIDYKTKITKTSHTLNPVEFIYVAKDSPGKELLSRGKLADIAPTVLHLMGLEIPPDMTADNLLCG
jgi:2,3-bisphosphoglycerate-independent phosphoglycerate mutase